MTGGCGYIGSHVVLALRERGWNIVVLDNLTTGFAWSLASDVPLERGDVGDAAHVAECIEHYKIGAIIHLAGSIIVSESVENPLAYYRNNTASSCTLIGCALEASVPHFLFSSSAAVYGIPTDLPVSENALKQPINPYGMSKLMTEIMLADTAKAHALNFCALRYFNVAGADPQLRSGQSSAVSTHLIKLAVQAALAKRRGKPSFVSIFGSDYATPDGTCIRDYIHVCDLAEAHVLALEHLIANPCDSLTLNCGYSRGYSVLEVLDAVERVADVRLERIIKDRRAGDPAILVADNRHILATLPWEPRWSDLDMIVAHALEWEEKLSER